ncbi:MAG: YggS family pyridoxal phosphate-dependent enzyme [Pyrinomonadaceae bacterium]
MALDIKQNLINIRRRITKAAKRSGRDPSEIKLVAVSKTQLPAAIRRALDARVVALGENKVQEAETKIEKVGATVAEWHLIGHLQKNKVRKAVQLFHVIHTVDSPELAHRLERICEEERRGRLSILVQVDLAGESGKFGVAEKHLQMLVESLKRCRRLTFDGLMILPPYADDPEESRPYFARLREIRDRLVREGAFTHGRGELSMGMSHDFEVAIEEGATIVRVGTAIFGERK